MQSWGAAALRYYLASERLKQACVETAQGRGSERDILAAAEALAERRLAWEATGTALLVRLGRNHAWAAFYIATGRGYDCLEVMQIGTKATVRMRPSFQERDQRVRR